MKFTHHVPILYSSNIAASIDYYVNVLCFDHHWTWDDPPTFGGVNKNSVQLFFCKECQGHPGTWLAINVDNVDEYYEAIKAKGAKIIAEPDDKEWGLREMLVQDPDNHIIRFGQPVSRREEKEAAPAETFRIVARKPTVDEFRQLVLAVGWTNVSGPDITEVAIAAAAFAVVAEEVSTGNAIGCALMLTDNASFYYVKDVMVRRDWQGKGIGTAMMKELVRWAESQAPHEALVGLFTGENLAPFYKQFGFSSMYGMSFRVMR